MSLTEATKGLGTLRIENLPTAGYDTATTVAMSQATGSCREGSATIETVQYLSTLARPTVNSCPVRRAPLPTTASEAVAGRRAAAAAPPSARTAPARRRLRTGSRCTRW